MAKTRKTSNQLKFGVCDPPFSRQKRPACEAHIGLPIAAMQG